MSENESSTEPKLIIGAALTEYVALSSALDRLLESLREALVAFRNGNNFGRDGVLLGLEAIAEFLGGLEPVRAEGLTVPVAILINALEALNEDNVQPLLKASPPSGRVLDSSLRTAIQATAVFTALRLVDLGLPTLEAHKRVASVLNKCGVKRGRGSNHISARTIRGWKDGCNKGHLAQVLAELQKQKLPTFDSGTQTVKIQKTLKQLEITMADFRAHEIG